MAPAKTATKQDGPQPAKEYTYPQGDRETDHTGAFTGWEVVSGSGRVTQTVQPNPNGIHEFTRSDGQGPWPVIYPSTTIEAPVAGFVQLNDQYTLYFRRPHGTSEDYELYNILLFGLPQTRRITVSRHRGPT